MKRLLASILLLPMLVLPVRAESIKWVDFNVSCESMKYALEQDIATFEQEKHISWIDILALAACRTGGKCALASVKQAVADLKDKQIDVLYVVGDRYSNNSNRLAQIARDQGIHQVYLIDDVNDIQDEQICNAGRVAVTSGASTPTYLTAQVIAYLEDYAPGKCKPQIRLSEILS